MHLTEKRKNRITLPKMKADKESGHSSSDGIKSILLACSGQGLRHKQGMQCGRIIWQNFLFVLPVCFPSLWSEQEFWQRRGILMSKALLPL